MKRIAHFLAALAVLFSVGPAFAGVPPIPPPAPIPGEVTPYTGWGSSGGAFPNSNSASVQNTMTACSFWVPYDLPNAKYLTTVGVNKTSAGVETLLSASSTWDVKASVAQVSNGVVGTRVPIYWSGVRNGTFTTGDTPLSDSVGMLKGGYWYCVFQRKNGSGVGWTYQGNNNKHPFCDGFTSSAGTVSDFVDSGTPGAAGALNDCGLGFVGTTTHHSISILGASQNAGEGTDASDGSFYGNAERAIGYTRAFVNFARSSTLASQWTVANQPRTFTLVKLYSDTAVHDLNFNDYLNGATAATMVTRANAVATALAGGNITRIFAQTLLPASTGTTATAIDGSDQTGAGTLAEWTSYNTSVMTPGGLTGYTGGIDQTSPMSLKPGPTPFGSNLWKPGCNKETTGTFYHQNAGCYRLDARQSYGWEPLR